MALTPSWEDALEPAVSADSTDEDWRDVYFLFDAEAGMNHSVSRSRSPSSDQETYQETLPVEDSSASDEGVPVTTPARYLPNL